MCYTLHRRVASFNAIVLLLDLLDAHEIVAGSLLNLLNDFHSGIMKPL